MQVQDTPPDATLAAVPLVLSLTDVCARLGLSRNTIRRLELAGDFPRRRQLSAWRVGWLVTDIEEWLRTRQTAPLNAA